MAWKATGQPTVRKQRDKWVVRVDGIDTVTGDEHLRPHPTEQPNSRRRTAPTKRHGVIPQRALLPLTSHQYTGTATRT